MGLRGLQARPVVFRRQLLPLLAMAILFLVAAAATAAPSSWSPVGDLPVGLQDHVSVTLADGRVLVLGPTTSVQFFDPATNTFSPSAIHSLFVHDGGASAVRLNDGRVLLVAGWPAPDKAELFDPVTNSFSATANDPASAHLYASLTLLSDGRVLLAGGEVGSPNRDEVAVAEIFDPATNTFSLTGSLKTGRRCHGAALLAGGRVLIVGGDVKTEPGYAMTLRSAEIYDPATGQFEPTGSMESSRTSPSTVALPDGKVLVFGWARNSAEVYDPATGRFQDTGGPTVAHDDATATVLPDGRVLVAAGSKYVGPVVTDVAELYWPAYNAFGRTASLNQRRQQHSAALLNDGRVLVSGGSTGAGPTLGSAEVFTLGDETPPHAVPLGPQVPGGRIQGHVYDADTGLPVAGVFIYIRGGEGGFAKTNASGEYYGDAGLSDGSYYVTTSNNLGYINQVYGGGACAGCDPWTSGTPVVVAGGGVATADFYLDQGPRIQGTVTASDTGTGIPRVWVEILNSSGNNVATALTDSSGVYANSAGLPPGDYYVRTGGSSYLDELYPDVPCKFGCDYHLGGAVTVTDTIAPAVDFVLDPGASITGGITDGTTGDGLGGIRVELWDATHRLTSWNSNPGPDSYMFRGLPAGTYFLKTSNSFGYVNQVYDGHACISSCDAPSGTPVVLAATAAVRADFALMPDADDDGDGILNTVDRNATTGADEQAVPSNDFNDTPLDGGTVGTISDRGGWGVRVADLGEYQGVSATLSGAGASPATIDSCPAGDPERTILDAATESVALTCGGTSTTALALFANPLITVRKPLVGPGIEVDLPTAHEVTIGSPVRAGWQNIDRITVRFVDALGATFGSFELDAGESVDARVIGSDTAAATVLYGTVTIEVRGEVVTLRAGESHVFSPPDATPPVITPHVAGTLGAGGWYVSDVQVTWTVEDPETPITATLGCGPTSITSDTTGLVLTCTATSAGGTASASVTIKRDATPPTLGGLPHHCVLWPHDGRLVPVAIVQASDGLGLAGPPAVSVTSNESSRRHHHQPDWLIRILDASRVAVWLRREVESHHRSRIYELTATASDLAGNIFSAQATCVVPHDRRHGWPDRRHDRH